MKSLKTLVFDHFDGLVHSMILGYYWFVCVSGQEGAS